MLLGHVVSVELTAVRTQRTQEKLSPLLHTRDNVVLGETSLLDCEHLFTGHLLLSSFCELKSQALPHFLSQDGM